MEITNASLNRLITSSSMGDVKTTDTPGELRKSSIFTRIKEAVTSLFSPASKRETEASNNTAKLIFVSNMAKEFGLSESKLTALANRIGVNDGKALNVSTARGEILKAKENRDEMYQFANEFNQEAIKQGEVFDSSIDERIIPTNQLGTLKNDIMRLIDRNAPQEDIDKELTTYLRLQDIPNPNREQLDELYQQLHINT